MRRRLRPPRPRPALRCKMNARKIWLVLALLASRPLASVASGPSLTLKGHAFTVYSVAFSPDGRLLASASNGHDLADTAGEIKLWDLKTGREVLSLRSHRYGVWKVAFSPDGKRLASAGKDDVVK